jgi:hypothetical protein
MRIYLKPLSCLSIFLMAMRVERRGGMSCFLRDFTVSSRHELPESNNTRYSLTQDSMLLTRDLSTVILLSGITDHQ